MLCVPDCWSVYYNIHDPLLPTKEPSGSFGKRLSQSLSQHIDAALAAMNTASPVTLCRLEQPGVQPQGPATTCMLWSPASQAMTSTSLDAASATNNTLATSA